MMTGIPCGTGDKGTGLRVTKRKARTRHRRTRPPRLTLTPLLRTIPGTRLTIGIPAGGTTTRMIGIPSGSAVRHPNNPPKPKPRVTDRRRSRSLMRARGSRIGRMPRGGMTRRTRMSRTIPNRPRTPLRPRGWMPSAPTRIRDCNWIGVSRKTTRPPNRRRRQAGPPPTSRMSPIPRPLRTSTRTRSRTSTPTRMTSRTVPAPAAGASSRSCSP